MYLFWPMHWITQHQNLRFARLYSFVPKTIKQCYQACVTKTTSCKRAQHFLVQLNCQQLLILIHIIYHSVILIQSNRSSISETCSQKLLLTVQLVTSEIHKYTVQITYLFITKDLFIPILQKNVLKIKQTHLLHTLLNLMLQHADTLLKHQSLWSLQGILLSGFSKKGANGKHHYLLQDCSKLFCWYIRPIL